MNHYKPYPAYKDSGVEWIGRVPEHWTIVRAKNIISTSQNGVWGLDPLGDGTDTLCIRVADFDRGRLTVIDAPQTFRNISESDRFTRLVKKGDLLLEKSGGGEKTLVGAMVQYKGDKSAVCSNFVAVVRLSDGASSDWANYLFSAMYSVRINYKSIKQATGIQNLDSESYFDERVALPSFHEQIDIALSIDRETTRIDSLITKKTRFIELLKEKRQALITHAVTKGLDPKVKMKDSGVEWIGEVPEHWKVLPVKFKYEARLGKMIQPNQISDDDILVDYHRAQTVQWESIEISSVEKMWASPTEIKKFTVSLGDLLICEGGDVCRGAIVDQIPTKNLIFQNSIHRVRPLGEYGVDWVLRLMQHIRSSGWIDVLCNKNTIVHFTSEKLGSLACPLPPPDEQKIISEKMRCETTRIDALIQRVQRSIELLKERRSAFITAAVTGQIDLREST